MSNEERERRLPKWARDELRDLRYALKAQEEELAVRRGEARRDPLRDSSRIVALMHSADMKGENEVELPVHQVRFYTENGTFDVRIPIFDHEQGIRVSCDSLTIKPEVSNVVQLTGRSWR